MFVPAGLDSDDLINLSCLHRGVDSGESDAPSIAGSRLLHSLTRKLCPGDLELPFTIDCLLRSALKPSSSKGVAAVKAEVADDVVVEDEQSWLEKLHSQLQKYGRYHSCVCYSNYLHVCVFTASTADEVQVPKSASPAPVASVTAPESGAVPVPTARTRRASTRTTKPPTAGGQDPTDFFKNLLNK